jgi:hypothetical protein
MNIMFWIALITIAALTSIGLLYLPWGSGWLIAAIVIFLLPVKRKDAFWAGLCGVGLAWFTIALITDIRNEHILSSKMALLFGLNGYVWMLVFTLLIGCITGVLGAWLGWVVKKVMNKK